MMRKRLVLWGLFLMMALVGASVATAQTETPPLMALAGSVELKVMTFNIWRGGELVDFGQIVAAVQAADADVVGVQEGEGNIRRLAEALGWQHYSERTQIISRYPLIDPAGSKGLYVFVQILPGQVVAVANIHLPSDPYGPYAVRDGESLEAVLALEAETRLPFIQPALEVAAFMQGAGIPLFLTGDFNAPSHRDWTAQTVGQREAMLYPVEWPVSMAVEAAGFVDTYRTVHPDARANPGITWTYGYPYPRLNPDEVVDRIDFVYALGADEILASDIVGDAGRDADIELVPHGSDHRAVVSSVRVTPVVPPLFVGIGDRSVVRGERVVVNYHTGGGEATDRIGIVAANGDVNSVLMWQPPYEASFFGAATFGTGALEPGEYAAILIDAADVEVSRATFWVTALGAIPSIATDKTTYAPGETITVTWANAPALRWDWIAVYAAGDPDLYNGYYAYLYTQATVAGSALLDAAVLGDLPPGAYVVRLLLDDGYSVMAATSFTVGE